MLQKTDKFEQLIHLYNQLNYIEDFDAVLDRILIEARKLTNADAGTIYLREDEVLQFSFIQNDTLFTSNLYNYNLYFHSTLPMDVTSIAGHVSLKKESLNIPDVYKLSNRLPYKFDSTWDEQNHYHTTSMLTVPIISVQGNDVGVIQLINAKDEKGNIISFSEDDSLLTLSFSGTAAAHIERSNLTREMILRMIKMAELRDPKETGPHVQRVGAIASELYEHWAIQEKIDVNTIKKTKGNLRLSAMLHDVGKIAISDLILKKSGKLTPDERLIMKRHTLFGAQLFHYSKSELDQMSSQISLHHHENWDGSGYPGKLDDIYSPNVMVGPMGKGLENTDIPLFSRIVKIADVYDALVSQRVYKHAWDERDALKYLEKFSGKHYDPQLIEHFFVIYDIVKAIENKYQD